MANSKIRQSARGEECQVRLDGACNFNPETTILAHLGGAGMGRKSNDVHSAYCCSSCHDIIDRRVESYYLGPDEVTIYFYQAIIRTQIILLEKGLIKT